MIVICIAFNIKVGCRPSIICRWAENVNPALTLPFTPELK